ncbi:MAG: hypothetical protein AAFR38_11260 [Planctomycetota bacterium]
MKNLMLSVAGAAVFFATTPAISQTSTLYGVTGAANGDVVIIDVASGIFTGGPTASGAVFLSGLAFDQQSGTLYSLDVFGDPALVSIDLNTSQATEIGGIGFGGIFTADRARSLAFDSSSDTLFALGSSSSGGDSRLLSIDAGTGAASVVGSAGLPDELTAITYDPVTDTLYGVTSNFAPLAPDLVSQLVEIDRATGAATVIAGLQGASLFDAIAVNPFSGGLIGFDAVTGSLLTIDPLSGATGVIGETTRNGITGLAFVPSGFVPAPGAAAALGLGGLLAARRRR